MCIAALKQLRKRGMRIGGRHRFVVIDESKFAHKQKVGCIFVCICTIFKPRFYDKGRFCSLSFYDYCQGEMQMFLFRNVLFSISMRTIRQSILIIRYYHPLKIRLMSYFQVFRNLNQYLYLVQFFQFFFLTWKYDYGKYFKRVTIYKL